MREFIRIILFVLVSLATNVNVVSAAITFSNIKEATTFSFHIEIPKKVLKVIENDLANSCKNEWDLVDYRNRGIGVDAVAAKGVTRSLDDLSSLRGASWKEAELLIPKDWTRGPLAKGEGIKFVNTAKKGEQILLEKGWPGAKDPLHSGPYMKVSRDGTVTRIPLQGNPTLK